MECGKKGCGGWDKNRVMKVVWREKYRVVTGGRISCCVEALVGSRPSLTIVPFTLTQVNSAFINHSYSVGNEERAIEV